MLGFFKLKCIETSLAVQWLRLCASVAGSTGLRLTKKHYTNGHHCPNLRKGAWEPPLGFAWHVLLFWKKEVVTQRQEKKKKMDSVVGALVSAGLLWYILFHVEKHYSLISPNPIIYILFTQTEYTHHRLYFGWWLRKESRQWLTPNVSFSVAQDALSTTLIHSFLDSFLGVAFFISFEDIKKMNAGVSMIHPRSRP